MSRFSSCDDTLMWLHQVHAEALPYSRRLSVVGRHRCSSATVKMPRMPNEVERGYLQFPFTRGKVAEGKRLLKWVSAAQVWAYKGCDCTTSICCDSSIAEIMRGNKRLK